MGVKEVHNSARAGFNLLKYRGSPVTGAIGTGRRWHKIIMAVGLALVALAMPIRAALAQSPLSEAIAAATERDFERARALQSGLADAVARDVVQWVILRAEGGTAAEYPNFLERRSDWPGLPYLHQQGEGAMAEGGSPDQVIAYFGGAMPLTTDGLRGLLAAHEARGNNTAYQQVLREAWVTMPLSRDLVADLLVRHRSDLAALSFARLDMLLWEGETALAEQMMAEVESGARALAAARLALRAGRSDGINALIDAVPAQYADDAGLAFERFRWRVEAGLWDGAREMMLARSNSQDGLGRPEYWSWRRASLARDVMREGDFAQAYQLAAPHFLSPEHDASDYAELEWLAGYNALKSGNAARALTHFEAMRSVVDSPISSGRAGYWIGRAHEALGNTEAARSAYAHGAEFQSSFYGQLAAERGGFPQDEGFLGREQFGDWRQASFANSSVFHAALLLHQAGEGDLAERFMTHLTESLSRAEAGALAQFALELREPHYAVMIAKRAALDGHEIMPAYFPVTDLASADLGFDPAFVLSIARRESEFNPTVISPAGARGLMQVMPRTAQSEARRQGIAYEEQRLLSDPAYNARLGAGYLQYLSEDFGTNPVLLAVAYNAGPSRATSWIERFGDPRDPSVDIVDWIEAVPFTETRNYIMRVTESLQIYEARLTGALQRPHLSELLQRR